MCSLLSFHLAGSEMELTLAEQSVIDSSVNTTSWDDASSPVEARTILCACAKESRCPVRKKSFPNESTRLAS